MDTPFLIEHHVPREQGRVYEGADSAFVLMHLY